MDRASAHGKVSFLSLITDFADRLCSPALAETNDDPADQPLESDMGYGQSHRIALLESRGKQPLGRQDARSMYQLGGSHGRRTGAAAPSSAKKYIGSLSFCMPGRQG